MTESCASVGMEGYRSSFPTEVNVCNNMAMMHKTRKPSLVTIYKTNNNVTAWEKGLQLMIGK
jgi:hypothetical protein